MGLHAIFIECLDDLARNGVVTATGAKRGVFALVVL
jgi:hypothetical protein